MTDNEALAYCAGLIDGEGCIKIQRTMNKDRKSPKYETSITVRMTAKQPVEFLTKTFNGNLTSNILYTGKIYWSWTVLSTKAKAVAERLLPFLVFKKNQAELLIEFQNRLTANWGSGCSLSQAEIALRDELWLRLKALHA